MAVDLKSDLFSKKKGNSRSTSKNLKKSELKTNAIGRKHKCEKKNCTRFRPQTMLRRVVKMTEENNAK
jgi:hypothetical protein